MGPFLQGKTQALVGGEESEPQGLILVGNLTTSVGQHQQEGQTESTYTKLTRMGQRGSWCLLPLALAGVELWFLSASASESLTTL